MRRDGGSGDVDTTWSPSRHPTSHCHRVPVGMLDDKLDAVAAAGFDGVEIFENDLIASSSTPARNAEFNPPPARSLAPDPRWRPASQARCPAR